MSQGGSGNLLSFAVTCDLCVFREALVPRLQDKEFCYRISQEIVIENLNLCTVKGNKVICPDHFTVPSSFASTDSLLYLNQG